jgi:Virulence factor membrane-bound polymerase, C-terminal/O-Antigen ligase/Protein glycosylation ligase
MNANNRKPEGIHHLLAIAGLLIIGLGFLMPGHYPPWPAFENQLAAALGSALIGLGALALKLPWRWPAPSIVAFLVAAVPLLQWALGQISFVADAVVPAVYLLGFGLTIAAGYQFTQHDANKWPAALMAALLAAACVSVALAAMQWLDVRLPGFVVVDLRAGTRPYANLAQPNHLALLLALGLAATFYFFESRRIRGVTAAVLAAWLAFGIVMSQSRTSWLAALALVAWWAAGKRRAGLRLGLAPFAVGLLLFAAMLASWSQLNQAMFKIQEGSFEQRTRIDTRPGLMVAMLKSVGHSPWVGFGWNQVILAQEAVAFEQDAGQRPLHNAHSTPLDLVLMMGLPLGIALLIAIAWWLWRRLHTIDDGPRWSLGFAVIAVVVHTITEFPLDYTYFLLPFGLLVGTLGALTPGTLAWRAPRWSHALVLLASIAMTGWIAVEYRQVEDSFRQLRFVNAGIGLEKVPDAPPPQVVLLDGPREYHRFVFTPALAGMSDSQLDWMRKVALRVAYPPVLLRLALADGLNGRAEESARVLRAICHMHPPKRCDEARESWRAAQDQFPVLKAIPAP